MQDMTSFSGDLSKLWSLQDRTPLHHLTWDWWWWLVMLDDPDGRPSGRQLMVLWSTKDNDLVEVNGVPWMPAGRPGIDDGKGMALDGMVCAWWFDGKQMHEPVIQQICRIISMPDTHPNWPGNNTQTGKGGGAVVPLLDEDLSMGLKSDLSSFWIRLSTDEEATHPKVPKIFDLNLTPWNSAMSTARQASATYAANMGYDILRLHGTRVNGKLDNEEVKGTAYFQKVCVQAPSVPWYWGMLHLNDGSYIDWFLPHVSFTVTARDNRPWKRRDAGHLALSQGGLFHDPVNNRTERFSKVLVQKLSSSITEGEHGNSPGAPLPVFEIKMWNGRTTIELRVQAIERAHWTFDQPTRGGLKSHLTYNEYPLRMEYLRIQDEFGIRNESDYEWARGNAEHSWGLLH
ncbi:MAG: hypothetical protein HOH79_02175 [Euryarchaeota archaeon]|nr:hypothetical protein [Euryarchaeota archaeon]